MKCKNISGIELRYFQIDHAEGVYRICFCHDADCFSDEVLRGLLLSDEGEQITLAAAVSLGKELKIKHT